MNKRIATKIVMDRILPAVAPLVAGGEGLGMYSDREIKAARVFVKHKVVKKVKPVKGWIRPQ